MRRSIMVLECDLRDRLIDSLVLELLEVIPWLGGITVVSAIYQGLVPPVIIHGPQSFLGRFKVCYFGFLRIELQVFEHGRELMSWHRLFAIRFHIISVHVLVCLSDVLLYQSWLLRVSSLISLVCKWCLLCNLHLLPSRSLPWRVWDAWRIHKDVNQVL